MTLQLLTYKIDTKFQYGCKTFWGLENRASFYSVSTYLLVVRETQIILKHVIMPLRSYLIESVVFSGTRPRNFYLTVVRCFYPEVQSTCQFSLWLCGLQKCYAFIKIATLPKIEILCLKVGRLHFRIKAELVLNKSTYNGDCTMGMMEIVMEMNLKFCKVCDFFFQP